MMNHLRLDDAEKRLGNRIVPAVTLTAHTLNKAMLVKHLSKIVASILNPAIRMDNQASSRLAEKSRCRRFAATGYVCFESVVGQYLRRTIDLSPIAFILRATRFLLT
jgi:hypothetical protein